MLQDLDAIARHAVTPCGAGKLVWRIWGSGPLLVLLHGGTGSWRHWALNIGHLARGRTVLAPDLPGMGESSLPPAGTNVWGIAALIAQGLEDLLGPAPEYHLTGFSFGAVVAGHIAASYPERICSLTLVGAGGLGLPRSPIPYVKVRNTTGEDRLAAHRKNLAALMFAEPARIDELALEIQSWNSDRARLRSTDVMEPSALRDALERIPPCPLRVIYGERDAIAYPFLKSREDYFRCLRADVDFTLIENAGHWVAYEAADRFNALFPE